ncbi:MAG: AbrB/MazE/SpoVT family DNA-binding domain-containing protein, partial [Actinomycetota bacterium]|nr:AbrB/MazE/SpoVT family DNA-binding domain-containing protein [Actinomycetota bacterium]
TRAGQLVIPKTIWERLGLVAGEVEVVTDGTGLQVEPLAGSELTERAGRLVIPARGTAVSDDDVRTLRDGDQQ